MRSSCCVISARRSAPEDAPCDRRVHEDGPLAGRKGVEPGGDDPPDARRQLVRGFDLLLADRRGELLDEERISLGHLGHLRRTAHAGSSGEELHRELLARLVAEADRAGAPYTPGDRRPRSAARRGAPAARAPRTGPARRGRVTRASPGGRAGSSRPSGCPRTGASSGRASPATRRRRAPKRRASLDPRPFPPLPMPRSTSRCGACSSAAPRSCELCDRLPRAWPVLRRARRCRRSLPSASRAGRRRCRARSPRTASRDREEHVLPGRRRAWPARCRAATSRSRQARIRWRAERGPPRSPSPRFPSTRRAHARDRPCGTGSSGRSPIWDVARTASQAWTGALLPFASTGWAGRYSIDVPGRDVGLLTDDDGSGRRRRLKTRRRVHDVSGHHRLPVVGPRVELDDRFARVHRDPHLHVVLFGPVSDGEGRADGSLRIVPVRRRRAEDPHDRVADELLDSSAEALQPRPHLLVVRRQERTHVLGVERFGTLRGPHEVDEEDRRRSVAPLRPSGLAEGSAARVAELRAVRVFLAAAVCR